MDNTPKLQTRGFVELEFFPNVHTVPTTSTSTHPESTNTTASTLPSVALNNTSNTDEPVVSIDGQITLKFKSRCYIYIANTNFMFCNVANNMRSYKQVTTIL